MNEISELWVTCDRSGKMELFTDEPFSLEGEWCSNTMDSITISPELLTEKITYSDGAKKVYLTFKKPV